MERADDDRLWSNTPIDILELISSRLVGRDYIMFCVVCKSWRLPTLTPRPPPLTLHEYDSCINTPCLMTIYEERGEIEFFNPLYNAVTHKMNIPHELKGSRIRCAIKDWLLMSQGRRRMFFFNPITKVIIQLPDIEEELENQFPSWTFSCPPDSSSSDCFVVGFFIGGSPPLVCIIKVGDNIWTYHIFYDEDEGLFMCNNPVFFKNNSVYLLGNKGNLGILSIEENSAEETPTWEFYWDSLPRRLRSSIEHVFTAEDVDNGGILVVFLTHEEGKVEVWRYNVIDENLEREQITSLDNRTLFVKKEASFLKPCIAPGLGNKIFFSMFHDNNKAVFYCLATRKYYSFNAAFSSSNCYKLDQPTPCIWIDPSYD
ncbi:F-box/kelch-repeat protein At1g57790-like [Nicotiana tabacum]|uniref:F-box/kelch-repeat protein At1g57790-like n=1 Tax=Nicotiana tabacum TaxID=4097 RepID=A0AC58TF09_TOBAC